MQFLNAHLWNMWLKSNEAKYNKTSHLSLLPIKMIHFVINLLCI